MSSTRRLALLLCDEIAPCIKVAHGGLADYFLHFLTSSLTRIRSDVTFTLDIYDVVNLDYPPANVRYDGLLISGSTTSAYKDIDWINALIAYLRRVTVEKPYLKIFGVCFGHQIIARAFGGACVPNDRWEVAVTAIQLSPIGKAIFGSDELHIQQMHRDHVPTAPPNAYILGSTDITPNHGMVIFHPESTPSPDDPSLHAHVPLTSVHMITVQGHPEFTPPVMAALLDSRTLPLTEDDVRIGHLRKCGVPGWHYSDGLACDGVGKVGKVMWGMLGVA